jgi:magnesium transporter
MSRRRHAHTRPEQTKQPTGPAQITVRIHRPGKEHCEPLEPARISDEVKNPENILWVDIRDPGEKELEVLREEFGFHRLALEDVARQQQRPKVDEYPGYYFVVMYAALPTAEGEDITTTELDLFVGANYVVALHNEAIPAVSEALKRWEKTEPELRKNVGFLLHTIMDSVVDAYFPLVDLVEDRLDQIEFNLYAQIGRTSPEELLRVKRNLFTLRKAIYPVREIFNTFLSRDQPIFIQETRPYFQDVYDHVLRLLDIIDIQRDMATGALDAYLAVISNRLNETMQRLTVVGICVAMLGAIFGAWGMNTGHVPFDNLGVNGFYLVSGAAMLMVIVTLVWAKIRGLW